MSGKLITIEGIDGAGKTTVIEGTENIDGLRSVLPNAEFTTEPKNDTWLGKVVRKAISRDDPNVPPTSVFFLFLAEHANHVDEFVKPNLEKDKIVICDRYIDSRYAYQSYELEDEIDGDTLEWIRNVQEQKWTEIPDATILLDISVDTAMKRLEGDEIFENREKLEHFRDTYLELAQKQSDRYFVVNAEQEPEDVIDECLEIIEG
jgi:dTMP kinase